MTYKISEEFMKQFIVVLCDKCGLMHAPIRTCEETRLWQNFNQPKED